MYHHSFERTMTYDDTLGDWLSSAASTALRDRVQLQPSVPNRHATFFSNKALDTQDFEVRFSISATDNGEGGDGPRDGVLAFWLSLDNFAKQWHERAIVTVPTKVWDDGLIATKHTFLSNKPKFKGLLVAFVGHGKNAGVRQQHVVGVWNDGSKSFSREALFDQAFGGQIKAMDWMTAGTEVKVRVHRNGSITGHVMTLDLSRHLAGSLFGFATDGVNSDGTLTFEQDGKLRWNNGDPQGVYEQLGGNRMFLSFNGQNYTVRFEGSHRAVVEHPRKSPQSALLYGVTDIGEQAEDWTKVFELPGGTFPLAGTECYVGFTGWTGSKTYIEVDLTRLETTNFDPRTAGEDESDLLASDTGAWLKVLEEEKRYVSQASQTEAISRLLALLKEHVDRYNRLGEQVRSDLVRMEGRMDMFERDLSTYLAALQAWSFEAQKFDAGEVKDHIVGIRAALSSGNEQHDRHLHSVSRAATDLKALHGNAESMAGPARAKVMAVAEQSKAVEEFAAAGASQTNGLLFVIVLAVGGLGLLFLNRMRYYEKKHYI